MDKEAAVQYVIKNNIDGVFIECGVGDGQFERIWINELKKYNTVRDIYMYDTFSGLTMPGKYDYTCEKASWNMNKDEVLKTWEKQIIDDKTNGWCYTPLEKVKESLEMTGYPSNKLHYIVGDVLQTLQHPENIPDKIAILRLDTDWYESSKFELEQMYDSVVRGGLIIFDDYYHWDGQRRATDEFFTARNLNYNFINIGNGKTCAIVKK